MVRRHLYKHRYNLVMKANSYAQERGVYAKHTVAVEGAFLATHLYLLHEMSEQVTTHEHKTDAYG